MRASVPSMYGTVRLDLHTLPIANRPAPIDLGGYRNSHTTDIHMHVYLAQKVHFRVPAQMRVLSTVAVRRNGQLDSIAREQRHHTLEVLGHTSGWSAESTP